MIRDKRGDQKHASNEGWKEYLSWDNDAYKNKNKRLVKGSLQGGIDHAFLSLSLSLFFF